MFLLQHMTVKLANAMSMVSQIPFTNPVHAILNNSEFFPEVIHKLVLYFSAILMNLGFFPLLTISPVPNES